LSPTTKKSTSPEDGEVKTPTILSQCSAIARELVAGSDPFDETDVIRIATERAPAPWSEEDFAEAEKQAPQVISTFFRQRRVVRFGPVKRVRRTTS
jgi:hypothetical protein